MKTTPSIFVLALALALAGLNKYDLLDLMVSQKEVEVKCDYCGNTYLFGREELKGLYTELTKIYLTEVPSFSLMYRPSLFHAVNESVWTNFPAGDDGRNIPPADCTDGYGIAALYELELVNP